MSVAGFMNVHPHFNPEEAAHAAIEFVSSLDNLPAEVNFLLGEITEKDEKINNLLARIHQRHYGLTKNVKHLTSQPPSGTSTPTGAFTLPIPPGSPLPLGHMTSKDQQTMQKIQSEWAKVEQLQMDKITLATRLESLISRARERGQAEWRKVGGMDLDEIEKQDGRTIFGEMGGAEVLLPSGGLGSGSDGRPQKKKRPNALPLPMPNSTLPLVVHPPQSSMPPPPAPRPSLSSRASSRHGRQISTSTLSEDPDADGEADDGGDGDADNMIYCFCQKKSYGEMIGCDNEACEFEWFHVTCVSMQDQPLPETWYCPVCVKALGMISSDGTRPGPGGQRGQKARRK